MASDIDSHAKEDDNLSSKGPVLRANHSKITDQLVRTKQDKDPAQTFFSDQK
jgi:hypothetical protein